MAAAQPASSSCANRDNTFGPHAGRDCRGGFDFTLLFEDSILVILPICLVLPLVPARIWFLLKRAKKVVSQHGSHLDLAASAWIALGVLQLAALVLVAVSSANSANRLSAAGSRSSLRTISLAAAALTPLCTLGLCVLSYAEHWRSVRPSTLLCVFLFATLLFDITRTRSLWLRSLDPLGLNDDIAYVSVASVIVKAAVLVLEALNKTRLLHQKYRAYPPEATSGIFNRSFFWWLNPLFRSGFGRVLGVDDLFTLDKHLQASYLHTRFRAAWSSVAKRSPYSLLVASFGVLKSPILQTIPPRACLTALIFCQPFLINRAIKLSEEAITNETTQIGYGLIGAYLLVYVGIAVCMGQYQHRTYRTITMVRGGLISIIYRKTGSVSLKDVDPAASMTLMSADIERVVQGWQTMHEIWSNSIEVGVAIYLLERQLGVACVVPVAVSILSLLGSIVAMNFIMSRQAMWLEAIERRISATSAMLASIKGVKMCGLKDTLLASLQQLRVDELRISKKFRKLIIWNMTFAYVTQVFAPVLTFAIFSVRARNSGDMTLDTARIFTSLSLFALLSEPLASLVMSLAAFLGAVGSFTRIQTFLQSEEREDIRLLKSPTSSSESESKPSAHAISVHSGAFGWDSTKPPLLKDINLTVPWSKLTMIVGPVGCGKSTLLHALLGEIPTLSGSVRLGSTSVAYCAQNPWHMNGTVREAIIGSAVGRHFDAKWYARVVHSCALRRDFEQLPLGDGSRIGSGGIALSGGQSQRIALARAVYARRKIVILDDVLSGLDTSTENHVFHSLFGEKGIIRELGSTVVVVSSSAKRLPYSDHIISLGADGQINGQGTFHELNNAGGYVSSFSLPPADWKQDIKGGDVAGFDDINSAFDDNVSEHDEELGKATTQHKEHAGGSSDDSVTGSSETAMTRPSSTRGVDGQSGDDKSRRTGDVQIYLYYVRSVGWWATLLFVAAIVGFVFSMSFPTVWVQWWAADNQTRPNDRLGYWLGVYAALGATAIVCLFLSCWQMIITMVPRSGEKFHFALLKTVLSAPMSFFTTTDSGVTLNRFSQDLQLIDMELPIAALNTFATLILCIAQMALIGVGSIYAAISFPVVLLALYLVQKFYLRTSRQLRLMDLETKAPLYSLFEESLSGLTTVRAFGWHDALEDKNHTLLDRSQRPFYLLFAVQRWLTLVLDLIVAAVAVLLMVLVVELRGTVAAGGVGLALLNVIQFSQNIKLLVTFWTTLETHIGSVARVRSFTENAVSEDLPGEDQTPPENWPANGAIEFENLSASYNGDDLVLKSVSLSIRPGEKIGICGRTGSGKTSLIMSLFRIVDPSSGTIRVDGIDIATLPRQEVRQRIVGVPQHAFLLKGSVRLNADPIGAATDEAIVSALQCVQIMDAVNRAGGLDADIDSLNLSSGQRQLFCLARAMLRPSTILVLDEATSSIDSKTEEVMQRLIRKKFSSHTIIAVAHRLETIMDFDKVAVLDAGRLVEFDSPYALLDVPGSAFGRLYSQSMADEDDDAVEVAG
ncbi:P-loop containing nucleoside triphosphate hydrolase protein [Apodospora peruviana]|uniref:P-loop containing nucleoside triphosphate hydrolase protein n=1 Tax=Apodospora peruviana TaxID=516989 RepID=A0AAE0M8Z4_9PEZI|nr:P-loop containing nucleoside triphosphate hydrolase protein [Apodospora peruviana]